MARCQCAVLSGNNFNENQRNLRRLHPYLRYPDRAIPLFGCCEVPALSLGIDRCQINEAAVGVGMSVEGAQYGADPIDLSLRSSGDL